MKARVEKINFRALSPRGNLNVRRPCYLNNRNMVSLFPAFQHPLQTCLLFPIAITFAIHKRESL